MPSGQGQAGSRGFDRERVIFYERRGGLRCFRPQICGRRGAEAAEGAPLNSDNERLFHHRAFEVLIADLDDLMFDNRKADGSKGRLRHQAGMHPMPWFVGGAGASPAVPLPAPAALDYPAALVVYYLRQRSAASGVPFRLASRSR